MNKTTKELHTLGKSLIGKKAQSRLLTMINDKGQKVMEPAQLITNYEIVYEFLEPVLMVIIGGESVYEDTLINIH